MKYDLRKKSTKYSSSTEAKTASTYGICGSKALQRRQFLNWVLQNESVYQGNSGILFPSGRRSCIKE